MTIIGSASAATGDASIAMSAAIQSHLCVIFFIGMAMRQLILERRSLTCPCQPSAIPQILPVDWRHKKMELAAARLAPGPPPSRVIPVSLLTEHDGLIHFEEHPLDHRLRQSVPLQCLIIECIERHQHFELGERCLPKVLV